MSDASRGPDARLAALKRAVLESPGALEAGKRGEICDAARRLALEQPTEPALDAPADGLVRAVVTAPREANVAGALAAGTSEDAVFEIVIAAALGAALARAEAGLTALGHRS